MYEGIYDLPIYNWWELNEKGDLSQLLKEKKPIKKRLEVKLKQRFKRITDQFFDEIALNDEMNDYILKLYKLQSLRIEYILTQDNYILTKYLILEAKIKDLQKDATLSARDNYETKTALEKHMGRYIDIRTTPVKDYHSYIADLVREVKAQRIAANRLK